MAFVEIYQDCNVFNSGAFEFASKKEQKVDNCIYLEHGKPLIFGANRDKGVRLTGDGLPQVVSLNEVKEDDLIFHDEKADDPSLAFLLGRCGGRTCRNRWACSLRRAAVVRRRRRRASGRSHRQVRLGDVQKLIRSSDTWEVTIRLRAASRGSRASGSVRGSATE
ncbi:MAG: hypothetical protein U0992_23200 [Planctomycetaceae bacterium]